jgi:hypothetical protein
MSDMDGNTGVDGRRGSGRGGGPRGEGAPGGGCETPRRRSITLSRDMIWPAAVVLFLVTVVLVNVVFVYVAVRGADEVAPSYVTGDR